MAVGDDLLEERDMLDQMGEHSAESHIRSAEHFDQHAALLERFGAHRCAETERRHAEEEREAARAARRN